MSTFQPLQRLSLFAAGMCLCAASAVAADAAEPAASTGVVAKVGHAVKRGASAAVSGVQRGAKAAEHGVKVGAHAAAKGVETAAKAVGRVADSVAEKVKP